jgi:hypothetical protein
VPHVWRKIETRAEFQPENVKIRERWEDNIKIEFSEVVCEKGQ